MNILKMTYYLFTILALAILAGSVIVNASGQQQETPPPPTEPRPLSLPKPVETTLPNGLRVIVVERPGLPLVTARLLLKTGAEADPQALAGLANMTALLLTRGTETRTAPQIAEAIESLGGSIDSGARWDSTLAQIDVMSGNIEPAMHILGDVIRRPAFKDEEIERLRQQTSDELLVDLSEPGTIARAVAARLLYGDTPYGHLLQGTPESVARIKRSDILALHARFYRPDNAILIIGGNIKAADANALARRFFGDWRKPAEKLQTSNVGYAASETAGAPSVVVVDKPDAGQAAVLFIHRGMRRADPDYFRGIVTNAVLSGYSGRLNQEIRVKRGLSYGAGSSFEARRDTGPFIASAQTKNPSGAEVASLLVREIKRMSEESVADTELGPRKASLVGGFGRGLETNNGIVGQMGVLAVQNLSLDEINTYTNHVRSITSDDVRQFAGRRLGLQGATVVIVGDAKQFLGPLQKEFPAVQVIPMAQLDLNSGTLHSVASSGTN